ncbi:GNAT family N-acetyltransferase [Cohnella sp. JJ-181]|uniref:GNAT family N-acetyltransferase n=1 Tax=Cohnella rhizoplanae TaxID=2974897 RepID=UPI0022FF4FF2|nr:GNAT family protein [Cohnella sp. JJ-181]CAI6087420.1 [Ribosomal protein S5]-alanine N-acetyltransferase [Cohnella sp. JJ-181]
MMEVYIRRLKAEDADALLDLRLRNRAFFEPYEPVRSDRDYAAEGIRDAIDQDALHWERGSGYGFGIFLRDRDLDRNQDRDRHPARSRDPDRDRDRLIGRVNLSNVVRGAWESCTVGYYMDREAGGRGYMTEALRQAVGFAFGQAGLHRVQASIMPRNQASIRVVEKNGFRYEGLAEYYLKINGVWEHHSIYSLTREHLGHAT